MSSSDERTLIQAEKAQVMLQVSSFYEKMTSPKKALAWDLIPFASDRERRSELKDVRTLDIAEYAEDDKAPRGDLVDVTQRIAEVYPLTLTDKRLILYYYKGMPKKSIIAFPMKYAKSVSEVKYLLAKHLEIEFEGQKQDQNIIHFKIWIMLKDRQSWLSKLNQLITEQHAPNTGSH